jgi:hypothetical protein
MNVEGFSGMRLGNLTIVQCSQGIHMLEISEFRSNIARKAAYTAWKTLRRRPLKAAMS